MKRGILGVPKDPKNRVLFSFNPRFDDDWPSSDSDDSDGNWTTRGYANSRTSQSACGLNKDVDWTGGD